MIRTYPPCGIRGERRWRPALRSDRLQLPGGPPVDAVTVKARRTTVSESVQTTVDDIALVEETGELLPGIEVVPEHEACYINGHRLDRVLSGGEEERR